MRLAAFIVLGLALGCSGSDGDDDGSVGGTGNAQGGKASTGTGGKTNTSTAGSNMTGTGGKTMTGGTGDDLEAARIRCVDRTNELRATKGLKPIPRLASAEACADGQAKSDSETGKAHGAFDACADQVDNWHGIAQNECPGYGSVESTLTTCLDQMWAEGPGGGHYDNMTGKSTQMACGIYVTPQGKVWLVQDYWTQ